MSERGTDFAKGLFIGGLIGAILGILYAPKSGRETREDISKRKDELIAKAKEEYEQALEKSKRAYEAAMERLNEAALTARAPPEAVGGKVGEIKERGKETLEDGKSRLKRAIDAGVDAFKEEKEKNA